MAGGDPMAAEMQKKLQGVLENDVPGYQAFQIGGTILGLAVAIALLVGGIALLSMKRWARSLVIAACLIAVASTAFQAIYQTAFVMPVMKKAFAEVLPAAMPPAPPPQAEQVLKVMQTMMTMVVVGTIILYVILIIYLLIIVMLLSRRHVGVAFTEWERMGYEDQVGDEPRRLPRDNQEEEEDTWKRPQPPAKPDEDWHVR